MHVQAGSTSGSGVLHLCTAGRSACEERSLSNVILVLPGKLTCKDCLDVRGWQLRNDQFISSLIRHDRYAYTYWHMTEYDKYWCRLLSYSWPGDYLSLYKSVTGQDAHSCPTPTDVGSKWKWGEQLWTCACGQRFRYFGRVLRWSRHNT